MTTQSSPSCPGRATPLTRRLLATALCLSLVAAACGDAGETTSGSPGEPTATPAPAADVDAEAEAETEQTLDGEPTPVVELVEDQGEVVRGGTLRVGLEADVDGLNPTASALAAPGLTMANAVFETLTELGIDGVAVPYLAESVEPVDGDLTRWRVRVRDGIRFHDGTMLDADAVRVNYETQLADPLLGIATRPFVPDEGALVVVDDMTVEYRLLEPSAVFPAALATQIGMVASPTWLAATKDDPTLNQAPVGTGPFRFDSRSQDSLTRVVRNDDWWRGEANLDAIEFLPVPDPATRATLLAEGDLDALHVTDPRTIGVLFENDDLQHVIDESGDEQFIVLNTSAPPFDDLRARQAFALATPLASYRALVGVGVARGADQMFAPESPFFNPEVVQVGDDPAAAAELVAAYCADVPGACSDGRIAVEYRFAGPSVAATNAAELLAEGWAGAFDVTFNETLQDSHAQQVVLGQYQAALFRGFGHEEPTLGRINLLCRTVGGISINFSRFCDEARDELIFEAQATVDPADRAEIWHRIVESVRDSHAYVFLLHLLWATSFAPDVHGICDRTSPDGTPLICTSNGRLWFDTVWLDR